MSPCAAFVHAASVLRDQRLDLGRLELRSGVVRLVGGPGDVTSRHYQEVAPFSQENRLLSYSGPILVG